MYECGVFILRAQPFHKAHLYIIRKALKECEKMLIVLGSADKKDTLRNPYEIELRKKLVLKTLQNEEDFGKITLFTLDDWNNEDSKDELKLWGRYLYYNIVSRSKTKNLRFYYSDDPKIMLSWFEGTEIFDFLSFSFLERNSILEGLSSTKVRQAIYDNDMEYIEKYCPQPIIDNIEELRDIWMRIQNNYSIIGGK